MHGKYFTLFCAKMLSQHLHLSLNSFFSVLLSLPHSRPFNSNDHSSQKPHRFLFYVPIWLHISQFLAFKVLPDSLCTLQGDVVISHQVCLSLTVSVSCSFTM